MSKVAFWNTADLQPPPENVCEVQISLNNVNKLYNTFKDASATFEGLNMLDLEAAMLSRVIWRSKYQFRADKMLHRLEAVNRGLLKYLALNIQGVYSTFGSKLCDPQKKVRNSSSTVLPSRQMVEWILVRTQGFARLFCYLAHNCEEAAKAWIDPIKRGCLFSTCPIALGILSRIWVIVKKMIAHACHWYEELLPFRLILKSVGLRWLPSDYKLPENLTLWLNMPHITDVVTNQKASIFGKSLMQFLDMSDDEDSKEVKQDVGKPKGLLDFLDTRDDDDCQVLEQSQENKKRKMNPLGMDLQRQKISKKPCTLGLNDRVDIGEVVSREIKPVPAETNASQKNKKKKKTNMSNSELNTRLGAGPQCATSSTSNTEKKKKVKHSLPKEAPTINIANKQKFKNPDHALTKKKNAKKMSGAQGGKFLQRINQM